MSQRWRFARSALQPPDQDRSQAEKSGPNLVRVNIMITLNLDMPDMSPSRAWGVGIQDSIRGRPRTCSADKRFQVMPVVVRCSICLCLM